MKKNHYSWLVIFIVVLTGLGYTPTLKAVPIDSLHAVITHVNCFGGSNGQIDLTVYGGTSPFSYYWNDGFSLQDRTNLPQGTYSVTVYDNDGHTAFGTYQVNQPSPISLESTVTPVSCYGGNDGAIDLSPTGGTPPFTFVWSNGSNSEDLSGLVTGIYSVSVTDAHGCFISGDVLVSQPAPTFQVTPTVTAVSCYGDNTGSINLLISGGSAPFTFLWNDGATTENRINLYAGTYSVSVTDAQGLCSATQAIVTQPTALAVTSSITQVSCFGTSSGSIDLSVSGGTSPYFYNWSNGAASQDLNNIPAGTYSVIVSDQAGCANQLGPFELVDPPQLILTYTTGDVSCNGGQNGFIDILLSGGTQPYSYAWNTGATTPSISGLTAGNYTVTATDNLGCQVIQPITINQPNPVNPNSSVHNATCFGADNGYIIQATTGGTPPYFYQWSNGSVTPNIFNLGPGSYTVTITDSHACISTYTYTVQEPGFLWCGGIIDDVSCNGGSDGGIIITVFGGTLPYSFLWNDGTTTKDRTDVAIGTYTITVTDVNNCTYSASFTVEQPETFSFNPAITQVSCFNGSDGIVNITPSGGTAPYSFLWSNGDTLEDLTGVPAGIYQLTITDDQECIGTGTFTVTQPELLTVVGTISNITCPSGNNGSIELTTSGGTQPYSYLWSDNSTEGNRTGLTAGTYTLTVTDNLGCTATGTYSITQPGVVSFNEVITNLNCNGSADGSILVDIAGGTEPYTYLWSNGATSDDITNLAAGIYSLTVTDNAGCSVTNEFTVTQPDPLSSSFAATHVFCFSQNSGMIDLTTTGGTGPYTWLWNNNETTEDIANLVAGTYSVTITDNHNCTAMNVINITEPDQLVVTGTVADNLCYGGQSGTISLTVTGGTSPFTYLWNNSSVLPDQTSLPYGNYSVSVTDNNGCTATASFSIGQPAEVIILTDVLTHVSCNSFNDGAIDVEVSGGTPSYGYSWSNGSTSQDISGLTAGTYTLTVSDNDAYCTVKSFVITQPDAITVNALQTQPSCFGASDGTLDITVTGGTAPYTFTWSNGSTDEDITNITGGSYTVTVTDNHNCNWVASLVLNQPDQLQILSTINAVTCNGASNGSIDLATSGGTQPYTWAWSGGQSTEDITDLDAGLYTVTITDNHSCQLTQQFEVTQPNILQLTVDLITPATCHNGNDGAITLSTNGGTLNYSYLWNDGVTTEDRTSLTDGTYQLTVTDANGCTATGVYVVNALNTIIINGVVEDVSCIEGSTGAITLTVGGGTEPYSFTWNDGSTDQNRIELVPGIYSVTVADDNGCTQVNTFTVNQINPISISSTVTNISCYGMADGSITVSGSGGTTPYSWEWSNGGYGTSLINLTAGTYTVTVSDINGCFTVQAFEITEPLPVTGAIDPESQTLYCSGDSLTPIVYIPYYYSNAVITYQWSRNKVAEVSGIPASGTGIISGALTNNTNNDQQLTFTINVTVNGCNAGTFINYVSIAGQLDINFVYQPILCHDSTTQVQIQAIGGAPPYTGQQTVPLGAGTHIFTVSDNFGCTHTDSVTITEPSAIEITGIVYPAVCSNQNNAGVDMTVTGGVGPYTYLWPDGNTNEDRIGLLPGNYTVTVTDNNNCAVTHTFMVTSFYTAPMGFLAGSPMGCLGQANPIYIYLSGTPPWNLTYSINSTIYNVNNIYTTTYTFYVTIVETTTFQLLSLTDAHCSGIVTSLPLVMQLAPPPSASMVVPPAICKGQTSQITVNLTGTPPFSLTWFNGTAHTVNNIMSNTYTIVSNPQSTTQYSIQSISDVYCASSATVPPVYQIVYPLPTAVISGSPAVCQGNSASVQVAFTGNPPWSFTYNDGAGNHTVSNINTTPYNLTLTPAVTTYYTLVSVNDFRCSGTVSGQAAILVHPRPTATWTGPDSACFNTDISLAINLTGTPPWSFTWNDGMPHTLTGVMYTPYIVNSHMTLDKTFSVTSLNDVFCQAITPAQLGQSKTVTIHQTPTGNLTGPTVNCYGVGSDLQVALTGTAPWSINLYDGITINTINDIITNPYLIHVDPATTTTYYLTGIEDSYCTGLVQGSPVTMSVSPAPVMNIAGLDSVNYICEGTQLILTTNFTAGDGPFVINYLNATGEFVSDSNLMDGSEITFSPPALPGNYLFTLLSVAGSNGCEISLNQTFTISVIPAPQLFAGPDTSVTLGDQLILQGEITGGVPPFDILWTPSTYLSDPTILNPLCTPLVDMTYTLHVTDSIGCEVSAQVNIAVDMSRNIFGYLTYDNTVSTPLHNVLVKVMSTQNQVIDSVFTDSQGYYSFNNLPDGSYHLKFVTSIPYGGVNATDALLTLKHFVHMQMLTGLKVFACDIDGSGFINAIDALSISRRFTMQINSFPIGDWYFQVTNFSIPTSVAQYDVKALCSGDANGSYIPVTKMSPSLSLSTSGEIQTGNGREVKIPVSIDRAAEIGAVSLVLYYSDDMLTVTDVKLNNGNPVQFTAREGVLRISWYDLDPLLLDNGGNLLTLHASINNNDLISDPLFVLGEESELADGDALPLINTGLMIPKLVTEEKAFGLSVNYPNPFSQQTTITYTLPSEGNIKLIILDGLGKEVAIPVNEKQASGKHSLIFNGSGLTEGIYLYRLEYENGKDKLSEIRKMTLIR
jgi:hypothetical protein